MKITSLKNETIKDLIKLKQKKYRDESGMLLIEGEHLVNEAQSQGLIEKSIGLDSSYDIEINTMIADKLSQTQSGSSVFALIRKPSWETIKHHRVLICEDIQDPGNLGTIIRSAYSFGFDAVYVSYNSVDPYNDKLVRSSQGALFYIPVIQCDLKVLIEGLKKSRVCVYATHLHKKALSLKDINKNEDIAIIFGSEGQGVSKDLLKLADKNLVIPTKHFESLNVAVAASIVCYEVSL